MEKTSCPSVNSKIEKPKKSGAWVRRSTRGPKELITTLDEYLQSNSDDDSVSNSENKLGDILEDKVKVKNDGEHSPVAYASVTSSESHVEYSNGLPHIVNIESQKDTESANLDDSERKKGRPRKTKLVEEGEADVVVDVRASKRKQGRPRKAILVQEEEDDNDEIYNLDEIELIEQEETDVYPKAIYKKKRGRPRKTDRYENDIDYIAANIEKKKMRNSRKSSLGEDGFIENMSNREKKVRLGIWKKHKQMEETTDNVMLATWKELFASKVFQCVNRDCPQDFITWVGLFDHMSKCDFLGAGSTNVTLLCHVCSKEFPLKPDFMKHMRLQHRDVYDLVHGLESGNATQCFNYTCSAEIRTYEDCIKHGSQCGSLVYCDKCDKSYKTRVYFSSHSCNREKARERKVLVNGECVTPSNDVFKRKTAKRKNAQAEEITDKELLRGWRELFASKVFQCIEKECAQHFVTWAGLYDHMNRCELSGAVSTSVTLLCHVCSKEFPLKPDFMKHMRLQHRDVYDLVHSLESGNATQCFNYTCSAEIQTYEDCIQHGSQCGSLVYCDKCDKSYKTRVYFSSHSCVGEKANESQVLVDGGYVTPSDDMAKRKAAKRRFVQTEEITDTELLAAWRGLFASKVFECINKECAQHFVTWAGLFDHMNKCEFPGVVRASITLLCHVCSVEFPLKPNFMKHIRLQHRDVYDLVHGLESGNATQCFNYTCSAEIQTYEDCIQHGSQCGSLVYCDKCDKSYKTRVYFNNHSCVGEKGKEAKQPQTREFLTPLNDTVKRRAAKRALDAIYSNDSDEIRGSSSNQLKVDNDFETYSDSNEDSAEYEDDDGDEDDDDDDNDDDGDGDHTSYDAISSQDGIEGESRSKAMHNLLANFTSILRSPSTVGQRKIVPFRKDKKWLLKWYERHQSSYVFPEWMLSKDDIQFLSEREATDYFPPYRVSPLFNVIYEAKHQHALKTEFKQLKIFEALHLEGSSIATMFVGGPVAAIEWCPRKGSYDQFLAVCTFGNFAQISKRSKKKDTIQIWRIPNQENPCKTVTLAMTIAVEAGPVFCMKWCPSAHVQESAPDQIERLGILALSCSDGCIRIVSVPHPSSLETEAKESKTNTERIAVKTKTVLVLAPSRKSLKGDESSNEIACIEWQPSNGHEMIAAGYSDGSICIWKLKTKSPLLRLSNENDCCDVLLPFSRINAHLHCVNSLSWCPTDSNFIVSVSFEKSLKIFDIREKESPPVISLKKNMFEQCVFLLRVCGISAVEDELSNSLPVGSRFLDLIYHTLAHLPYNFSDHTTSHTSACVGIGNSEWMNAIATSCCAGEVLFRALAHESRMNVANGGNAFRLPVYRTEVSELAANEEEKLEIDSSAREAMELSTFEKTTRNDPAKDDIRKRAQQLPLKMFKHKFTFKDSNFFEFRNKPGRCNVDVVRARCFRPSDRSNFSRDEMCHISRVQWNPNYGQHFLLASGGSLGFVRLHYFTKWK